MIRVGCCGWPVARTEYFRRFSTLEIDASFYNPPQLATASRWREEAPEGFEYSMKAWQIITHPSSSPTYRKLTGKWSEKRLSLCGHFAATQEVESAWERTWSVAQALKARFILFQTPKSFYPSSNHLRDMYRFFKAIRRTDVLLAWEARGRAWNAKLLKKICLDLGLIHVVDPMIDRQQAGNIGYYRLHGKHEGDRLDYAHSYSDAELGALHTRCAGKSVLVYFNNTPMWDDASRFQDMAGPQARGMAVSRRASL